jgi:Sulfotransferase family
MANTVFPMLVGCGRSGTTLIRNVLDSHPDLAVTHEAHFVGPLARERRRFEAEGGLLVDPFLKALYKDENFVRQGVDRSMLAESLHQDRPPDYAEGVRRVFATYAAVQGKPLYGDKTPGSVSHMNVLAPLFPESRFIHIIRDGRAVALSYMERPEWGPRTAAECAHHWVSRVERGQKAARHLGTARYLEVRYEDMVADPESTTRTMCRFLDLEYKPEMLSYEDSSTKLIAASKNPGAFVNLARPITEGLRDWTTEMSAADRRVFEAIAGDLLERLGYAVDRSSPSISLRVRTGGAAVSWQTKRVTARIARKLRLVLERKDSRGKRE